MSDRLETILLIEDDRHIREVAKLALTQTPQLEVTTCGDGREGVTLADDLQPDLILLDVMMPGIDGLEVLERLQDNPATTDIPVVFLTAKAQPSEIDRYRELGVIEVIVKPFDPMELTGQVTRAWEKRDTT